MSALAQALLESLERLLPPGPAAAQRAEVAALIGSLTAALEQGELGLDLEGDPPANLEAALWPSRYLSALEGSGWLADADALTPTAPLVRDGRWLRWRRWHEQLQQCMQTLLERASSSVEPQVSAQALRAARQTATASGLDASQSDAVAALLEHRLVLLRGGPGTGKTSTVVAMLAEALRQQPLLQIHLAAPTGKAAARLEAAVRQGAQRAELEPEIAQPLQALPCSTLHRLLEAQGDGRFRRDRRRPLELDLLVLDEMSMVDLPLMAALLTALPLQARLLLVGDPGQLPPVGAGAVLEELCRPARLEALGGAAVELRTTYRNNGAIAALASCLREQPAELPRQLNALQGGDNVQWWPSASQRLPMPLLERLRLHQRQLRELAGALAWDPAGEPDPASAAALLEALDDCIALSPVRQGAWGVEALHRTLLPEAATAPIQRWPLGTPVLNRLNRPEQGLANGDIGVLVQRGNERWLLLPGPRLLHPARFGAAQPALALTVHKAQGSQYNEVLLLVPPSRHSDPRLLYTGLTRARQRAVLITPTDAPTPPSRP